MLPTPDTSHVSYDLVYEPAEDSFLLLDTLSSPTQTEWLKTRFGNSREPSPLVAELGTGSGVVIAFAVAQSHTIFGRDDVVALGVDVNTYACKATKETVDKALHESNPGGKHAMYLGSLCADLGAAFKPHSIDVLIFNPPYVPTDDVPTPPEQARSQSVDFETASKFLSLSYSGGVDGMEITNRVLEALPEILSAKGVAYILFCASNRPEEVKARIRKWDNSWEVETVGWSGKTAGLEKLEIVRLSRCNGV